MANPLFDTLFGRHQGKATPFLETPDGTVITHGEFLDLAAQYAHVLVELGVKPGERVAVQIGKSPQALAVYAQKRTDLIPEYNARRPQSCRLP